MHSWIGRPKLAMLVLSGWRCFAKQPLALQPREGRAFAQPSSTEVCAAAQHLKATSTARVSVAFYSF